MLDLNIIKKIKNRDNLLSSEGRFDDVLEGPTELRASCSTHSCGVLQEKETD